MMHQKIEAPTAAPVASLSAYHAACELDELQTDMEDFVGLIWLASCSDDLDESEKRALRTIERTLHGMAKKIGDISERLHPSPLSAAS